MLEKFICLFIFLALSMAGSSSASLVAHWEFDESSGSLAHDISGNGNDGTLRGDPQWVTGKKGGAIQLDGDGDYVDVGSVGISGVDQRTLAGWAKASTTNIPSWTSVFGFTPDGDTDGTYFDIEVDEAGNYVVYVGGWESIFIPVDTQWHHFAATYNGEGGSWYLDGQLIGSLDGAIGTIDQVRIGARLSNSNYFPGLIDDVRIYDTVLTLDEIKKLMAGPRAYDPIPADGTLYEDTWVSLSWSPGDTAVSHDVYFGENFADVNDGIGETYQGNQATLYFIVGFPETPSPKGLVPGTTYYWRIDEVEADGTTKHKGDVWSLTVPTKKTYNPNPADGATFIDPNVVLSWTAGFEAKLHTVYFGNNFDDVNNATGGPPQGPATYTPGPLKLAQTYYWRVDEFDAIETHKGDVWSFTTEGAVSALNPVNGSVDVTQTPVLTWAPGLGATYDIYFGADPSALEKKASGSLGAETYEPEQLEWNTTYYWRVDEANSANADSPWTGPVWSFTTANFLIIDDMEAYNDLDPGDPASNRIFNAWIDGYDDPTNGSLVGNDMPPFAEQTIVHSGNQSMPMYYDNSAGKSEATLTLTSNRDWTVNGVNTLTIWFRGGSSNAAESLYVALNGSARVDNDNPDAATIARWTAWNIDLQKFTDQGVNLTNVNSITIGLSSVTGGTGMMYFDDIRLSKLAP